MTKITYYNFHYNTSEHDENWNHVTKDFENVDDCNLLRARMIAAGFICDNINQFESVRVKRS